MIEKQFRVSWADVDANSHMRNTAYIERVADVRLMYFADFGFSLDEFRKLKFGPVVRKDEVEYFREVHLLNTFTVSFEIAGLSEDCSRMCLSHRFTAEDGGLLAKVTTLAGWLDLEKRKLIKPPANLAEALNKLSRTEDFKILPSSIK